MGSERSAKEDKILVHLIGIGGIGMSAIAQILHHQQYIVQGSDQQQEQNSTTAQLAAIGVRVFHGHDAEHVSPDVKMVIVSSAIADTHPEVRRAVQFGIPVVKRAQMLAQLMKDHPCIVVTGTHGKTTTTSLIGHLLNSANLNPTIINGGVMNNYGSNVLLPSSSVDPDAPNWRNWFVVEGDESDGSMQLLPRRIAVITNIDLDHMTYYKTEEALMCGFTEFVKDTLQKSDDDGLVILCTDCPRVRRIYEQLQKARILNSRNAITYGFEDRLSPSPRSFKDNSHVQGIRPRMTPEGMCVDIEFLTAPDSGASDKSWKDVFIPLHGLHNLQNVLAAASVAQHFGVLESEFRTGVASFLGTQRRFTVTGVVHGITIIDDYAHHPTEIRATLSAARNLLSSVNDATGARVGPLGRLIALPQLHRFSRLQYSYKEYVSCFEPADLVLLLPIYTAGEEPIPGVNVDNLAGDINRAFGSSVMARTVADFEGATRILGEYCRAGDMVVCCGAGSITQLANRLPNLLSFHKSTA